MRTTSAPKPGAVKAAAAELREAVRELALRSITTRPAVAGLRRAADLVRRAVAEIDGQSLGAEDRDYRHRSPFQGELHPFSPTLHWQDRVGPDGQPGYSFTVTLSSLHAGPPNYAHGGYVAALFDELLGGVQALSGRSGLTAKLALRYRTRTPLGTELCFAGWIDRERGRRVVVRGTCHAGEILCAEAEALFVRPSATAKGTGV